MATSRLATSALAASIQLGSLFAAATAHGQACHVAGRSARFVVAVSPPGAPAFELTLEGVAVTATPPVAGARSDVEIDGDLVFRATAVDVPYRPDAPVAACADVVQLGDWSRLSSVHAVGADAVATADLGAGVSIASVRLPCSALTIDPPPAQPSRLREPPCDAAWWTSRGQRTLAFRATPGGASPVYVGLASPGAGLVVCALEHRGAWLRVANGDSVHVDGGQITGWIEQRSLRRLPGGVGFTGGRSMPVPLARGRSGVGGPSIRQLWAPVDGGTPVRASPSAAAPWATVRAGGASLELIVRDGDPWVQVASVAGVGPLTSAWIPRSAVHLP